MRRYKLLKESDLIPDNHYVAIVYYPDPSPNRNAMTEWVYYNQYKDFGGTDKDIGSIVDESVISVLFEYNPKRAYEIMQGGYVEDGKHNDLLKMYDFRLKKKLNQWLEEKRDEEKDMSRFKIKFDKKKDKEKLYDYIDYQLDIVKDKKKSVIVKAKDYGKVYDKMTDVVDTYNENHGFYIPESFDYDIEDLER